MRLSSVAAFQSDREQYISFCVLPNIHYCIFRYVIYILCVLPNKHYCIFRYIIYILLCSPQYTPLYLSVQYIYPSVFFPIYTTVSCGTLYTSFCVLVPYTLLCLSVHYIHPSVFSPIYTTVSFGTLYISFCVSQIYTTVSSPTLYKSCYIVPNLVYNIYI